GNVIQQPARNQNPGMLTFGVEGASNLRQELHVVNNTFLNDDPSAGTFVVVGIGVTAPIRMQNNVFAGTGAPANQPFAVERTNYHASAPAFMDRANFDLRPAPKSPMIDAGSAPGRTASGVSLVPAAQYRHVAGSQRRPVDGPIDIGAYEAAGRR
ncbi:MAG: parallel beta-helix repeat, partial [Noviherbaspirillum sp.]|nr:parallel beta-helix repeat [Noviherbaspirillum sp.]